MLADGGNAVDAAIAVAFALAVVFPEAGNIGGGGFIMYRAADGTAWALDFREMAPAGASRDMYLDPETKAATDKSRTGALAAGVPGSVAGLWEAHKMFATRPWKALLSPAIRLAEEGFVVDAAFASGLARQQERMTKMASSRALFYPDGQPYAEGSTFKNPELAAVLKRVADKGPDGFYKGETADLIVAEMKRSGGIMTKADLQSYTPKFREPIRIKYRGHEVLGMPPPSSGGLIYALVARVLEPLDLKALGWHSAAHVHRVAETMRHAFARRNKYLGDADFVDVPLDKFDSEAAAREVSEAFDPARITPSASIGQHATAGNGDHTTNFAIVDGAGGAIALTTTINTSYGSGLVVGGAGFLLNNEMDDFAAKPGFPNAYGLVQGEANAVAPRKRPLSSMSPTIVSNLKTGRVRMVTGAAGGSTIPTSSFQVMSNILDFGMDPQSAVAAPRFHHQHQPDRLFIEAEVVSDAAKKALEAKGHVLSPPPYPIGDAPSLGRDGDRWMGGVEVRQYGAAAAGPGSVRAPQ